MLPGGRQSRVILVSWWYWGRRPLSLCSIILTNGFHSQGSFMVQDICTNLWVLTGVRKDKDRKTKTGPLPADLVPLSSLPRNPTQQFYFTSHRLVLSHRITRSCTKGKKTSLLEWRVGGRSSAYYLVPACTVGCFL